MIGFLAFLLLARNDVCEGQVGSGGTELVPVEPDPVDFSFFEDPIYYSDLRLDNGTLIHLMVFPWQPVFCNSSKRGSASFIR